jgi:ATP synthase protein I
MSHTNDELKRRVERQARRMAKAERERPTLMAQTVYVGVLGLVFVLPVVGGAYLGSWLDGISDEYTVRWTVGCIFLGVVIGAFNVYFFIRD